jgi:hypothetical protein
MVLHRSRLVRVRLNTKQLQAQDITRFPTKKMEFRTENDVDGAPIFVLPNNDNSDCGESFLFLHYLLWGAGEEELQRLCSEERTSIPIYEAGDRPELQEETPPKESEEQSYTVLDIRKAERFQLLPSSAVKRASEFLPCRRARIMVLEDYKSLYTILCKEDDRTKLRDRERRHHGCIRGTPGIGRSLQSSTFFS